MWEYCHFQQPKRVLLVMVLSGLVVLSNLVCLIIPNFPLVGETKDVSVPAVVNITLLLEEWPHTVIDLETSPLGNLVRVENVCLEVQGRHAPILWTNFPPTFLMPESMTRMFRNRNLRPDLSGILPLRSMADANKGNYPSPQATVSFVEWIHNEHLLVQRLRSTNLFHWMQEGFFIHAAFPTTDRTASNNEYIPARRVFHIPTNRTFVNLADLSYAEFLHLIGVQEQRTIHGLVSNTSMRHLDEMSDEDDDTQRRWTCFSKALLGLVSPHSLYLGSRIMKDLDRQSYKTYLNTITTTLDITPKTPSTFCPADVTFILRHSESNATSKSRRLENWLEVQNELQARNISFYAVDIGIEKDFQSFRAQVQLARCQRVLVAAHGQSLWLTHFVPPTAAILEILPYGFEYSAYMNIAATNGILHYEQMRAEKPWPTVEFQQFAQIKQQLQIKGYNASQLENVRNSLIPLLQPKNYQLVTHYLQSLDLANADVLSKIMAREQPLVINAQTLVDRIEHALSVTFR